MTTKMKVVTCLTYFFLFLPTPLSSTYKIPSLQGYLSTYLYRSLFFIYGKGLLVPPGCYKIAISV